MTAGQRRDLMEIVEDRGGTGSTLVTSQVPVDDWHAVIGEFSFANAILDRLVHTSKPLPPRPRRPLNAQAQGRLRTRAGPALIMARSTTPAPVHQQVPPTRGIPCFSNTVSSRSRSDSAVAFEHLE
jgi:hypothetical protein